MHALVITFRSAIAPEELTEDFARYAEALRDGAAPGLVGKIWLADGSTVGGFGLFEDRGVADRYLDGMFAEAVTAAGGIDSDIVINTPNGDIADGHVVLDGATQTGTVTLTGGTGLLANLAADLVVAPLAAPSYSWDGPYSY